MFCFDFDGCGGAAYSSMIRKPEFSYPTRQPDDLAWTRAMVCCGREEDSLARFYLHASSHRGVRNVATEKTAQSVANVTDPGIADNPTENAGPKTADAPGCSLQLRSSLFLSYIV